MNGAHADMSFGLFNESSISKIEPAKWLVFKATIISKILSKKHAMNVNATANSIKLLMFYLHMVMRIWKYYLLQKTASNYSKVYH